VYKPAILANAAALILGPIGFGTEIGGGEFMR
jgi:hypothetical protein